MKTGPKPIAPEIRFHRFYTVIESGCWLWTGHIIKSGYGQFCPAKGVADGAHRYSYKIHKGEIPEGMFVCHKCNVKTCVNPEHLYLGSPLQNTQDAAKDGLMGHKLSADDVLKIVDWSKQGIRHATIAAEFGVTRSMISNVCRGETWRHVSR